MKYKSEPLKVIHQDAAEMYKIGAITEARMCEYDELCLKSQIQKKLPLPITEKNMDRFAGQILDVLIEEQIDPAVDSGEETIWLGRLYCHAPDIDGSAVITCDRKSKKEGVDPQPGMFVKCKIIARRGFDLKAQILF